MVFKPSKYQQAIYEWITSGEGNAVIQAVAGSGKTSTIVQATNLITPDKKCVFVAFNKSIAEELKTRLPRHIEAKTLHSLGLAMFRANTGNTPKVEGGKMDMLIESELEEFNDSAKGDYYHFLKRIIPLIKNMLVDYTSLEQVTDVMSKFNIEFEVDDRAMDFIKRIIHRNNEMVNVVDFDDMIYLPVIKNFKANTYDWVFVDEAQDLNRAQFELIKKVCNGHTRIVAVGDKRQSIYAFRGADTSSMENFQKEFQAKELPLSICYRCPRSHVLLAKEIVPEIEYSDTAEEGHISYLDLQAAIYTMNEKDLVLCRTNAPLVKVAFAIIRSGKKAVVRGRDIGKGLLKLIEKYKCNDMAELYLKLENYRKLQEEKLQLIDKGKLDKKKKNSLIANIDSVDTIIAIMEDCLTIEDIVVKIESIFSDDKDGIVCSSVHRAKGLEADNVFIINRDNMPHPMAKSDEEIEQEMNILYVALTRAKKELCLIKGLIR